MYKYMVKAFQFFSSLPRNSSSGYEKSCDSETVASFKNLCPYLVAGWVSKSGSWPRRTRMKRSIIIRIVR